MRKKDDRGFGKVRRGVSNRELRDRDRPDEIEGSRRLRSSSP